MDSFEKYSRLAWLFEYPCADNVMEINEIMEMLPQVSSEAKEAYERFLAAFLPLSEHAREEYFVRTFEVEAVTTMDLGFILFGEEYKRGAFLAMMQEEQLRAGNDTRHELADHLPNVMRLLPLMDDRELASELACSMVLPAVREISARFSGIENMYGFLFVMLQSLLEHDVAGLPYDQYIIRHDTDHSPAGEAYACGSQFLENIGKHKF